VTERYLPMLATLVADVPTGEGWLTEVEWGGDRTIARRAGDAVTLTSRRGQDLTGRFATVAARLPRALVRDAVVDGEVLRARRGRPPALPAAPERRGPGAPVATPLARDEVVEELDPGSFTMDVVRDRVAPPRGRPRAARARPPAARPGARAAPRPTTRAGAVEESSQ
jgi:hypothetical protein